MAPTWAVSPHGVFQEANKFACFDVVKLSWLVHGRVRLSGRLRSGGALSVLLGFQGLEVDQVGEDDSFWYCACLGDDVELFGVFGVDVRIDQHFFCCALSRGDSCNGVVHVPGMRNFAPIVKHKVRNIALCRIKELRFLRNFALSANERYVSRLAEQSIEESWKI